jgi:IS605 OrfB family transposase
MDEARATIKGRLELGDLERAKLLYTMRLFRDAVEKAHHLIKKGIEKKEIVKQLYWTIPNTHYAEAAYTKALLFTLQEHLKLKKPLLFSIGKGAMREDGNRNIKVQGEQVKIKYPSADGKHKWIEGRIEVQQRYKTILEKLRDYSYSVNISIRKGKYYAFISIPVELYGEITNRDRVRENAANIAAFDLNSDRINMTLLNPKGLLIEARNHHFPEINSAGYPEERAKNTRLKSLAELIDYATEQGVRIFVFEKLKMKGAKNISSKKGNRKLSRFAARELLSHAEVMVKKRGGEFKQVDPAYTSKNAKIINQDLGVDIHTASAFVLGLRYLHTHKST